MIAAFFNKAWHQAFRHTFLFIVLTNPGLAFQKRKVRQAEGNLQHFKNPH
ncbi:hypothetical protein B4096_0717 [Heyndrickxia coagulans]|nr:hypothetical protein B4100_0771 [Heyndrickxia coagulans]KYC89388.1 hypothetical protein B4096_0717 [Heyndrickxia coagulans]